ncbi:Ger(x)C family spore germination C-terminal domain-containing protein [Alkalihalobacillus deserti]|uniref:Ger(x)C family spore germination C-terminal domain-containing protein n=1 Tax=Alkalihalobacillus deserti TaxID=2879466 RepID=UPI00223DFEF6|nr:Ger(x)C family spore germination C-terminal domain-containing protein [Alkalihalobacillus deserti]
MNDGEIGIELSESKSDIEPKFQDDKLSIKVKITGEADVAEVNTKLNLMSSNVFTELEKKTNNEIKDVVLKVISSAQKEFRSDIFGFGEIVHQKNSKEWAKLKESWGESFPDVPVDVHVDIKIQRTGTISDPFQNELIKE